jgi:hypothetical protein
MGGLMLFLFFIRFFLFRMYESPKYLMGRGRDAEAVEVIHKVAAYNGVKSSLTLDMLRAAEGKIGRTDVEGGRQAVMDPSALGVIRRKLETFGWAHITPLFASRKLAWSTSLLIIIWGGFKLPRYL